MVKSSRLFLSEKHGVNPMVPKCYWCQEDKNEVVLLGKLRNDARAPHGMALDKEPCDKCAGYMRDGIICISVDESKTPKSALEVNSDTEFYRSGGWAVVKFEALHLMGLAPELLAHVGKARAVFLADDAWDMLHFPRRPDDRGHWTVNGVCACEAPETGDVLYPSPTKPGAGVFHAVTCKTTFGEFEEMRKAVNLEHPDADIRWVPGDCKKEGA